jgi:hypothetical protein
MESLQKDAVGVAIKGTIVEDDVAVNVSTVTTKQLVFTKPDGTQVTKTAAFLTDGSNGIIQYVTVSGFLDQAGTWSVQGYVVFPGGFDGKSKRGYFQVED